MKTVNNKIKLHMYVDKIELKRIMQWLEMEDIDSITDLQSFTEYIYEFYQNNKFLISSCRPKMGKKLSVLDKICPPKIINKKTKKNKKNGGIFLEYTDMKG